MIPRHLSGHSAAITAALGGEVVLRPGAPDQVTIRGVFRREPREIDAGGARIEALVPILRGARHDLATLRRGDLVEPGDGARYAFQYLEESPNPAPDALTYARLEGPL